MQIRFIRLIVRLASALLVFGLASAPALATEPIPINTTNIVVGDPVHPTCTEPYLNLMVSFADYVEDSDLIATLQQEQGGVWQPVMGGALIDKIAGNNGVVVLAHKFAPGEQFTLRAIVHPPEAEGVVVWPSQSVSLNCTDEPTSTQTATPPSRPSAEDVRDRLREQQSTQTDTVTPTPDATEEVAPTSSSSPTTTVVVGPVVETDIPVGSPSTPTWVMRWIAPFGLIFGLHLYLTVMAGNGGILALVSTRGRH